MRRQLAILTFALLAGCATGGGRSDRLTVLRIDGPSAGQFPVGRGFAEGDRFLLRAGDVLYLRQGPFLRRFRGPGSFRASMVDTALRGTRFAVTEGVPAVGGSGTDPALRDPELSRFILCPQDRRCPR